MQVYIRGAGTNTTMLHSDIQMRLAVATDPTLETTGAAAIFDRNINSNTVLGLDLATPRTNVDSRGRPNEITGVTLDMNSSAGVYDEAFAQGVIDIHYYPSAKRSPALPNRERPSSRSTPRSTLRTWTSSFAIPPSILDRDAPGEGGRPSGCRAFLAEPPTDCLQ